MGKSEIAEFLFKALNPGALPRGLMPFSSYDKKYLAITSGGFNQCLPSLYRI